VSRSPRASCLLASICLLGLVVVGGCSVTPSLPPLSPVPSTTPAPSSTPVPPATPVPPTAPGILACDSGALALPESVLQTGTVLDYDEQTQALFARAEQQMGWLSVRLELSQTVVSYESFIPFRLRITNQTDHPVSFFGQTSCRSRFSWSISASETRCPFGYSPSSKKA
jgi:hypothetical protein